MIQKILVVILILSAVFFLVRHFVKDGQGSKCEDCGINDSAPSRPNKHTT